MRYVLQRLGFYALAAWVAVTVNFILPRLMPGDPATAMFARFRGKLAPEAMAALREAFGLAPKPLASQYTSYLAHLAHGDLGISITYFPAPVSGVVATALGWTAVLSVTSLVLSFALGTGLGIAAAWRRGGRVDRFLPPMLSFVGAFPYFWLAMVALYLLGYRAHLFPLGYAYDPDLVPGLNAAFLADVVRHAALPVMSVVLASSGGWMLTMRSSMIVTTGSDFVRLGHARGLSEGRVMLRYAAQNAILPSVTSLGMALGFVLGGSLLTEVVFSYPGMGYLLVEAVRSQDYALMQGIFLVITLAVLGANFAVDVLSTWLDPRTRSGHE
jgi:peptide/nickel transport system permease protein